MVSQHAYLLFIGLVAIERLVELVVARRHAAWSFARGGTEFGAGHYPVMVLIHTGLLIGAPVEVLLLDRALPGGWPLWLGLSIATQGLRWWCISTLGPRWNTRVIIVPGLPPVSGGPYRFFPHPNYVAVALEGLALPLLHGAFVTAAIFTVCNAILMRVRIQCEDAALATLPQSGQSSAGEAP